MLVKELKELSNLSEDLGKNLNLIQGAGGNTSVKIDEVLWVKASGYWLSDANKKNIFVPVNYKGIIENLENSNNDPVIAEVINKNEIGELRPSIETTLHAVMPQKYVVHNHSVNSIVNTIAQSYMSELKEKLDGLDWGVVKYAKPGLPLTEEVRKVANTGADVIVLANHGIVIASNDIDKLKKKINEVEKRLHRPLRDIKQKIQYEKIHALISDTEYILPKYELVHSLALDKETIKAISYRSLYPDHVVFLGPGPMTVVNMEKANKLVSNDIGKHNTVVIENIGVIVHQASSENIDGMLHCLANTLLRVQPNEKLSYLSEQDELELLDWNAEEYRQSIQKKRV